MLQIATEYAMRVIDLYDKLPFLVSVKTDIQALIFTALDM
jgi:hypothetical protein